MKRIFSYTLLALLIGVGIAAVRWPAMLYAFIVLGPLAALAAYDMLQKQHTVLRNYPVIGHLRYLLEDMRHQIRQYFIQADHEGEPFTRTQRSVIYQRAKDVSDVQPFGTLRNVYATGYEWLQHSIAPLEPATELPRVLIGNQQCSQPYSASMLNISAMSFGSLSGAAIEALNGGAKAGGFAHDTGEGGISRFHRKPGGDLIWEIGTGYFGCRRDDGGFDPEQFRERAHLDVVKMIELKLSQGAKPGGGGILPAAKVTPAIAEARGVPVGQSVLSPSRHSAFDDPHGLLQFLATLREHSGGKPVGFKLCIGQPEQFLAVVKAMRETGITPDFITVDGKEGGTGAAPREFTDSIGTPLREGLMYVHNALVGANLRQDIRVIATGKIVTGFDLAHRLAIGADLGASARGMMFALGCIQARTCHSNKCPSGVATQDPWRTAGLVVSDKTRRVSNYHRLTLKHLLKLLAACGIESPQDLTPAHIQRRVDEITVRNYAEIFTWLQPGALLDGSAPASWQAQWAAADSARF